MYVGRYLVVGPGIGAYCVASRSFPNREAVIRDDTVTVRPTEDAPESDNPYISYNCVRRAGERAVVGNGSHVDSIAEKLEMGYPPRDALALSLLALDFEKDEYDTPRIAGVVEAETAYLGIVRRDALVVETAEQTSLLATYDEVRPRPVQFRVGTAEDGADTIRQLGFQHLVCSAGVRVRVDGSVDTAVNNEDE